MKRLAALALVAAAATGCSGGSHGTATLWITRDRGTHVLQTRTVPAGLTAVQALERVAHVQTRYAGRFVQAIDGLQGSLTAQRDWFYFVNGYEADRSAAEYRLHPGDVEWWDYRAWKGAMHVPVVVGAFPEPFLHGYDGKTRPAVVGYGPGEPRAKAAVLARLLHARLVRLGAPVRDNVNVLNVECTDMLPSPRITAALRFPEQGAGSPVFIWANCADPTKVRFRYALP